MSPLSKEERSYSNENNEKRKPKIGVFDNWKGDYGNREGCIRPGGSNHHGRGF